MSQSSWKVIGRELIFYGLVCPLCIVYIAIQASIGTILLIPTVIATMAKSWKWMAAFKKPWHEIVLMLLRLQLHIRCVYYQSFVPWNETRKARKAGKDLNFTIPCWRLRHPEFSDYDGGDVFALIWLMINSLFSAAMLMNIIYSWILVFSVWGIRHYYTDTPVAPTTPSKLQVTEVYQQQVADKQETDFGPWLNSGEVMDERSKPTFLNLALISDTGTMKYSQRYGSGTDGFAPYASEHIADAHISGTQVMFHDERHNKLRLNVGQVFLFENDNVRAYQFSAKGELLSTRNFKPQVMK